MIDLKLLKSEVELLTGVPDISVSSSNQLICAARSFYYNIVRKRTELSLREIGESIGIHNHALVFGGVNKLPIYLNRFPELESGYQNLLESIGKDKKDYYQKRLENLKTKLEFYKEKNAILEQRLSVKNQRQAVKIKSDYLPLVNLLHQVPEYHIDTVKMRLEPMIRMLEKPSIHNYLPKQ